MTTVSSNRVFYLDSSALVKRYVTEIGSDWIVTLCEQSSNNTIATARITQAEAAAAFASKHRAGSWPVTDYRSALQDLAHDFLHQYLLVDIDQPLIDLAVELIQRQKLRGYDAIQLAAAVTLNNLLAQTDIAKVVFVAADNDLLQAANNEYLLIKNPALHQ